MHIRASTLDDLLRVVLERLLKSTNRTSPTKGDAREIMGVILELTQPRARLSKTETKGTIFSCLGELLWYLSKAGDLEFIQYYIKDYHKYADDDNVIHGAYGPRLFSMRGIDQIHNVIERLRVKNDTRRAVIQLFNAEDIVEDHRDIPCTCTMQFMVRSKHLHMFTTMRSNDAFLGLPHDVFTFTMLQEIIARDISVGVGRYMHAVGSLHLYDESLDKARNYLKEGWQKTEPMPPIPNGDPWPSIEKVLQAEDTLRKGGTLERNAVELNEYWMDLVRLLEVYSIGKYNKNPKSISKIKGKMSSNIYDYYISRRQKRSLRPISPRQLTLISTVS